MRADICKGVNLDYLDKAIAEFERDNYPYCSKNGYNYLIMSSDTRDDLYKESDGYYNICKVAGCSYKGNMVAIDNTLPYGKVEIR